MRPVSIPAGILIAAWARQVATGSLHASTVYVHLPSTSTETLAPHRSVPGASSLSGTGARSRPPGSRRTRWAATASCPSRNTVAEISKTSSTTAFAGLAPQSTAGRTSSTGMRPIMMGSPGGSSQGSVTTGQPRWQLVVHALFALFLAAQWTAGLRAWPLLSAFTRVAGRGFVGGCAVRVRRVPGEPFPLSPRPIRALG